MRVELRVEGGFAGLRRPPLVLESSELEPARAREVEALAAELPPGTPPARGGADLMRYEVLIVSGGVRRSEAFSEPDVPDPVRRLLRLAREAAGGH